MALINRIVTRQSGMPYWVIAISSTACLLTFATPADAEQKSPMITAGAAPLLAERGPTVKRQEVQKKQEEERRARAEEERKNKATKGADEAKRKAEQARRQRVAKRNAAAAAEAKRKAEQARRQRVAKRNAAAAAASKQRTDEVIPASIERDSFLGFPSDQESESMWRTEKEVRHG